MSRLHSYRTTLALTIAGYEAEYEAHVSGAYLPGYRGDRTDPPEPATFEAVLVEIKVGDAWQELPDSLLTEGQLDALIGEMLIDHGECAEPAMAAE